MDNYQIILIKSWSELEKYKTDWERLRLSSPVNTIFQSFAWHGAWWQAFGRSYDLYVILVLFNQQIMGIAPLMMASPATTGGGHVYAGGQKRKIVEILGSPETEYQHFLVDPKRPEIWRILLDEIFKTFKNDQVKLWEIPLASPLAACLKQYIREFKLPCLHGTHSSFQLWLAGKINKQDIKYRRHKLQRLGRELVCRSSSRLEEKLKLADIFFQWLEARFGQSLSRYRRRQLGSGYKNFCRNLILAFSDNSECETDLVNLSLDKQVIAIDLTLNCGETVYGLLQTYHPEFANYSPGSILQQDSFNAWRESGLKTIDFLRGDESYKMRFANAQLPLVRFTFFPSHWQKTLFGLRTRLEQLVKPLIFPVYENYLKFKSRISSVSLKKIVFWLLWHSGIARFYQTLTKNRQRILCYHSISDHPLANNILSVTSKTFIQQMEYIYMFQVTGYKLLITFDDGYADNFTNAFPVLKKFKLPAMIFPTISFIEQSFVPGWHGEQNFPALTWEQMREMRVSGLVEFGSHTVSHLDLGKLTAMEIDKELSESKKILETRLINIAPKNNNSKLKIENCELKINSLAYPFGKKVNYNQTVITAAKQLGYTQAYTIEEGTNSPAADPYQLRRMVIFDEPMYMFKVRVSGIIDDLIICFKKLVRK